MLKKSAFTENIAKLNGLRIKNWQFEPGMLFGSATEWWGDKKPRKTLHSGLDIRSFLDENGSMQNLEEGALVPVIWSGLVVNIIKDFLGSSIFVQHDSLKGQKKLFSIYGHILPESEIMEKKFKAGTLIGHIAEGRRGVPSHLHFSIALVPLDIAARELTWALPERDKRISFLDPAGLL